ncbi:MAG TPA: transposase [Roseiarcus sp.]|nr:transposase [Roseiarcus sp.]
MIGRKLDADKQRAFIDSYEKLLNSLGPDEAVVFADAVHPTHGARPVGCWAPEKGPTPALEQTSGRQRLNVHGAIDLETGKTAMIDVETVDAASTIRLLEAIEAMYPLLVVIHVFLDNARYHHAKLVKAWLAQPGRRIRLHFIPAYCPHLNPLILSLSKDRTFVGRHARASHPQQMLRHLPRVRRSDPDVSTRKSPQRLEPLPQLRHRQFPRHRSEKFPDRGVNRV